MPLVRGMISKQARIVGEEWARGKCGGATVKEGSHHAGPCGSVYGRWLFLGGSGESERRPVCTGEEDRSREASEEAGHNNPSREMTGFGPEQQQWGWLGPGDVSQVESAVCRGSADRLCGRTAEARIR